MGGSAASRRIETRSPPARIPGEFVRLTVRHHRMAVAWTSLRRMEPRRVRDASTIGTGSLRLGPQVAVAILAPHVVADGLQPLQDGLPLFEIQLPQERPQPLNERVFHQRLAVRLRHKEAVHPHAQRLGDFLQGPQAGRHLPAFDARQIRTRHARAGLQLALRHAARLAQLPDALADILHCLAVRPALEQLAVIPRQFLRRRWRNEKLHLGGQQAHTPPAVARACAILHQSTHLAADDVTVEVDLAPGSVMFRHRLLADSSGVRIWRDYVSGEGRNWRLDIVQIA